MALNLARIIGTLTGKVAFERTNANFQAIETEVNANTIAIDEKLPTSHNTDAAAHEDIRERINDLDALVGLGGVKESGSNANGEYVKFENGIMVCWKNSINVPYSSATVLQVIWTYPSAFVTNPSVIATKNSSGIYNDTVVKRDSIVATDDGMNVNTIRIRPIGSLTFTSTDVLPVSVFAIGRWK